MQQKINEYLTEVENIRSNPSDPRNNEPHAMAVVAIVGKARSGKDTFGKALTDEIHKKYPHVGVHTIHFADLLKYLATNWFGWDGNKDEAGRTLLQTIGTDVYCKFGGADFWAKALEGMVNPLRVLPLSHCLRKTDVWLIPDTRIIPEFEIWGRVNRGIVHGFQDPDIAYRFYSVKIHRVSVSADGKETPFNNGLTDAQRSHLSETAMDGYEPFNGWTMRITNKDGDLACVPGAAAKFVNGEER